MMRTNPSPEDWVVETFGSAEPRILGFPHCVFPAGVGAAEPVLDRLGVTAGIFGSELPLVDRAGEPYIPLDNDEPIIEDFALWALPENQYEIRRWCEGIDALPIRWLIDAGIAPTMLRSMHDPWICWEDFAFYIDRAADWIDDLGWAMVPLAPEGHWVMVVVNRANENVLKEIEIDLVSRGVEAFHLERRGGVWQREQGR